MENKLKFNKFTKNVLILTFLSLKLTKFLKLSLILGENSLQLWRKLAPVTLQFIAANLRRVTDAEFDRIFFDRIEDNTRSPFSRENLSKRKRSRVR